MNIYVDINISFGREVVSYIHNIGLLLNGRIAKDVCVCVRERGDGVDCFLQIGMISYTLRILCGGTCRSAGVLLQ